MSFNRRALLQGSAATLALTAMPAEAQSADGAADRLLGRITEQLLSDYPTSATGAGVDKDSRARLRSRLDNRSAAGQRTIKGHVRSTLGQLRRLDTEAMSAEKRLDIDVVRTAFELAAEGFEFPYGDVAVLNSNWSYRNTPYAVAQNVGAFVEIPSFFDSSHSITTTDDADAYLARMEAYARQLDGETARVRADGGRGVVLPDFLLDKTLQQLRTELTATREQLEAASNAFENAQLTVDDIKGKLKAKIEQCRRAIQESKKAEVLKSASAALAELDTYGTASTAEKYLDEIKQKVAESKASVEVATGGLDVDRIKMERKARQIQAQSVLAEFEVEMGLKKPDAVAVAAPFPESAPADQQSHADESKNQPQHDFPVRACSFKPKPA